MDPTKQLYGEVCDFITSRIGADGLYAGYNDIYDIGCSLLALGLGRMSEEEREARLQILDATICNTLEKLDALHNKRKLNGKGNGGGLAV